MVLSTGGRHRYLALPFLALSVLGCSDAANKVQEQDLSFVAAIKGSRYDQSLDGMLTLTRCFFFTEIFLAEGGSVMEASLRSRGSTEEPWKFEQEGEVLTFAGGYFPDYDALDEAYPDEDYVLDIAMVSGAQSSRPISFAQAQGERRLPDPVSIRLIQDGIQVEPDKIDAEKDLTVSWSEFSLGQSDPNGIVDDLIFVILSSSDNETVAHSGRPFSGASFLTYEDQVFEISSENLEPRSSFTIVVEHATVLNSNAEQAVPVFASYATATYLTLRTTN